MCGRFVQRSIHLAERFIGREAAHVLSDLPEKFNLAPTQKAGVLYAPDGALIAERMQWGLLPFWAKKKNLMGSTINARVETVATKPAFRAAFKAPRRCAIPMSGYYEWTVSDVDGKKDPWFIHPTESPALWAAGLWEPPNTDVLGPEAGPTFAVITGGSSGVSADIHDRMPQWLDEAMLEDWMHAPAEHAMELLLSTELPKMEAYRVARAVNSPRNDNPALLAPVE